MILQSERSAGDDDDDGNNNISSSNNPILLSSSSSQHYDWLTVGRMVFVQPRTWACMNRPGGLGHIAKVHYAPNNDDSNNDNNDSINNNDEIAPLINPQTTTTTTTTTNSNRVVVAVDVKYLSCELTSHDKYIPLLYISDRHTISQQITNGYVGAACFTSRTSRRNAINSRRCGECGSFAIDCGDCDWRMQSYRAAAVEEGKRRRGMIEEEKLQQKRRLVLLQDQEIMNGLDNKSSSSNDDSCCDSSSNNECNEIGSSRQNNSAMVIDDSEEEEYRKVKYMNRYRKKNGQFIRCSKRSDTTDDDDDDDTDDVDDDDDEVPLAVLQFQKQRRRRLMAVKVRERKLYELNQMVNSSRDDLLLITKKKKSTKKKKRSRRTRPTNACTLSTSLPMDAAAAAAAKKDSTTTGEDCARLQNGNTNYPMSEDNDNDSSFSTTTTIDDDMETFANLRSRTATAALSSANVDDTHDDTIHSRPNQYHDRDDASMDDLLLNPMKELEEEEGRIDKDDNFLLTPREEEDDSMMEENDDDELVNFKSNVRNMEWGELPIFIKELCAQLQYRITIVQNKLTALKRRLQATKKMSSSSQSTITIKDVVDELDILSNESDDLNQYVIDKLHRHGIDLCNIALTRLLSKKERRKNEGRLTVSQKKLCRRTAIDLLDLRFLELCDLVKDIDSKVTAFQKVVDTELQSKDDNITSRTRDSDGDDDNCNVIHANGCDRRKKCLSKRNWDDVHMHASRKRKSSYEIANRQDSSQRKQLDSFERRRRTSLTTESISGIEDEDDIHSTTNAVLTDIDFIGDTDDVDDDRVHSRSRSRGLSHSSTSKRISKKTNSMRSLGGTSSNPRRKSRSITESISGWLDKHHDSDSMIDWFKEPKEQRNNRQVSENRNAANNGQRQSSMNQSHNIDSVRGQTHNRPLNSSSRTHRALATNDRLNQSQKTGRGKGSSRSNEAVAAFSRPDIPHALCAEMLFDSISYEISRLVEEREFDSDTNGSSVIDLCRNLRGCYPASLSSSRDCLANLVAAILCTNVDDLQKHAVITVFETLLYIFQTKGSTLLDILQTNPLVASFHMKCWSLVFQMIEKKHSAKVSKDDGLIYKVFANHTILVKHLLLQVIDVLYSQLLWEEWGQTSMLSVCAFDDLRSLCISIGSVVPLLPIVCGLITKLGKQRWYISLSHDRKENEPGVTPFVSAIDPSMHVRFIMTGELDSSEPAQESRLGLFKRIIPREEIEAIWSIIGYTSCCSTVSTLSAPDFKQPQVLLARLVFYDCGSLPDSTNEHLPPSMMQVNSCAKEIKWIDSLLSSRLLGVLPAMDSFIKQIIEKSVMLEAFDVNLGLLPIAPPARVNKTVKQVWEYSCLNDSFPEIGSSLQSDLMDVNFITASNATNCIYSILPSSVLLQRCISLAASYAIIVMKKNIRWKSYRIMLQSLASDFVKRAVEIESTQRHVNAGESQSDDAYTTMLRSIIESATEFHVETSQTSPHLREAACYLIFAGVVARSRYNVSGDGNNFHLTKAMRENIWRYSSDEKMQKHQHHFLNISSFNNTGEPAGSNSFYLLYSSSKAMVYLVLLHLYVSDFNADPQQVIECLRTHLLAVKAEIDEGAMVYLLTSIISNLISTCELLSRLNGMSRVTESEEKCKAHMNSSKSCVELIRSITIWINLVVGRAKFIVELMTKISPTDEILLQLGLAIKRLVCSKYFRFVVESLTNALTVIVETVTKNAFSKALSKDGCVETSFRSCIGAIRQVIALVHACGTDETLLVANRQQPDSDFRAAADAYLVFVTTHIMPTARNKFDQGEHRRLCHNQSGGVFSVLASLSSILPLSGVYDIFESKHTIYDDHKLHLQQFATCFSCELLILSKFSRCKASVMQNIKKILHYLLAGLVDSDALSLFPSCNLSLLEKLGGHLSRSKGNDLLSRVQIHLPLTYQHPDQESYKIKRRSGEYVDTAGPSYTSKNIWTFLQNVGDVLASASPYDINCPNFTWQSLKLIGATIVNVLKKLRSDEKDILELLPQVSVERECLKRLVVFQALLSTPPRKDDTIVGGVCTIVLTSIIEHLYYLSGIEIELEDQRKIGCDDFDTRYQRAKTLAFHHAYTDLSGTLMTLMLRSNTVWDCIVIRDLVRSDLILSAFRGELDIRRSIDAFATKLNLRLRKKSTTKGPSQFVSDILAMSFYRHASNIVAYIASCEVTDIYRALFFNSLLQGLPLKGTDIIDSLISSVSLRLNLTSEAVGTHSDISPDGLERAIDNLMLCAEVERIDDIAHLESIIRLREWVVNGFLAARLSSEGTSPPHVLMSLKLLSGIVKVFSSCGIVERQKICDKGGNLTSIATYTKLLYSLKECLCTAIKSSMDVEFIAEFFCCARRLLAVPHKFILQSLDNETATLFLCVRISYKKSCSDETLSKRISYMHEAFMWFKDCGEQLQDQIMTTILRDIMIQIKQGAEESNNCLEDITNVNSNGVQQCYSSLSYLKKLEVELGLHRTVSLQVSNPYAPDKSSDSTHNVHDIISVKSLSAMQEYIKCFSDF